MSRQRNAAGERIRIIDTGQRMKAAECCCTANPPIETVCKCYDTTRMPTYLRVDIAGLTQVGAVTGGCYGTGLCDNINGSYVLTYVPGANDYGSTFPPCEDGDLTSFICVWALDMADVLLCDYAEPAFGGGGAPHRKYKAIHMLAGFLPGTATTVPFRVGIYVDEFNNTSSGTPSDFDGCGGGAIGATPAYAFGWGVTLTASPANSNRVDCDTLFPLVLPGPPAPGFLTKEFTCERGGSSATVTAA